MNTGLNLSIRRLAAFVLDCLLVLLWAGLLFGAVMLATEGQPGRPPGAWTAQLIGFASMTVPVLLYFTLCESSSARATPGKRMLGLKVVKQNSRQLTFKSALLRNALKFTPWELGHTVANQAMYSTEAGFPSWAWVPAVASLLVPLWWLASILVSGRTPYDRCVSAQVVSADAVSTKGSESYCG